MSRTTRIAYSVALASVALALVVNRARGDGEDDEPQTTLGDTVTISGDVSGNRPTGHAMPDLAIGPDGEIACVYGAKFGSVEVIVMRISEDQGATWGDPEVVTSPDERAIAANSRGPQVAWLPDGDIVVTVPIVGQGESRSHLHAYVQSRRGRSFKKYRMTDANAQDAEGMHDMAVDAEGNLRCVWLDFRSGKMELWQCTSKDGKRWKDHAMVYRSTTGAICECCTPAVAAAPSGERLVAQFRNQIREGGQPIRDIWLSISDDGGDSFESIAAGKQDWRLDACPMDGGSVCILDNGDVVSVYRREQAGYLAHVKPAAADDADGETTIDLIDLPGRTAFAPIVTALANGQALVAWQPARSGATLALAIFHPATGLTRLPDNEGDDNGQTFADARSIATTDNTETVYLAWEASVGSGRNRTTEIRGRAVVIE